MHNYYLARLRNVLYSDASEPAALVALALFVGTLLIICSLASV